MSTHRCSPPRRSRGWPWKRAVTMSMRRSGVAVIRHSFSRPWVEKAACSRSTGIRRPSRPGTSALPTKCGLRSSMRRLPISPRSCRHTRTSMPCRGVLFDLGVSSPQLDDPQRGFSFRADGPLDMRMDPTRGEPVSAWLARAGVDEIRQVIATFGEERFARRVAQAIVARARRGAARRARRSSQPSWPAPCARASRASIRRPARSRRCACSSTTSSASSSAVSHAALEVLAPGGRLAVISFHSLEDRAVKRFMQRQSQLDPALKRPAGDPGQRPTAPEAHRPQDTAPARPSSSRNPRARSALLRVAEKQP